MFKLQYIMQPVDCEIIFLLVHKTVAERGAFPLFYLEANQLLLFLLVSIDILCQDYRHHRYIAFSLLAGFPFQVFPIN